MNLNDLTALYQDNQTLVTSLAALSAVGMLLLIANRMRKMAAHRATLLMANILTVIAAALATAVSSSGMWKVFTDILGESPLRYAFFWFIEIALFASALLARARLLREPEKGSTGVDGAAVWVFALLTASLSALDADSFSEVCLRLAAPLVAAWMWERALAAERSARLGRTATRINWTITLERVFVWLRLAEAQGRDVTEVDRARRRARLGRARLNLHLLQSKKKASAWRLRRAHNKVIRQAMQAAEHTGLADFPGAADEREAIQMYMATLYGFVTATTPEAVAHLNAWRSTDTSEPHAVADALYAMTPTIPVAEVVSQSVNGHDLASNSSAGAEGRVERSQEQEIAPQDGDDDASADRVNPVGAGRPQRPVWQPESPPITEDLLDEDDDTDSESDLSAVDAMRRFWDTEVGKGRIPTGAELSRAARVPPATGLGRRKRREWESELPDELRRPFAHAGDRE
ncbi:hypothetical protein GA0070216_10130 [Micromonospora matsumotoense]|uniref:DUF2637 domain-containing protein n=1 Tax=Micromonospora matsumotoense TaxID=121616 RepID=A0A1C4TWD3_9ACTN|nr:hypothetical protein [Micromonospora matsumotoense]SCE63742.1 hypothetical protein GA0070216_10130 [Micromonospora matsumotoense]